MVVRAVPVGGKMIPIRADEVAKYCDETFYSAMERWALTKMWGMPHGGGWAEEPVDFIDAITTLENEQNAIENEEMEKSMNKGNVQTGTDGFRASK